jgi:hypothetical protein
MRVVIVRREDHHTPHPIPTSATSTMTLPEPVFRYLYTSRMADGQPVSMVADILRRARERNQRLGLTGALIFDGERFAQLLEGEPVAVMNLVAVIQQDARHTDFTELFQALDDRPRLFGRWSAGWSAPDAIAEYHQRTQHGTWSAVEEFVAVAQLCDMS